MNKLQNESRIDQLSKPKPLPPGFSEDRRSVYWTDQPLRPAKYLTSRQRELALPKHPHKNYQGDRPSPIWRVSPAAKLWKPNRRLSLLAAAKNAHPDFKTDKPVWSVINKNTLNAERSERIITLSRPKGADSRYINPSISLSELDILRTKARQKKQEEPEWVDRLSQSKQTPKGFRKDRPVRWRITPEMLSVKVSDRVDELSNIRRIGKNGNWVSNDVEDPYAVSKAAMKASVAERIENLCKPIPRKMRSKKEKVFVQIWS